MVLNKNLNFCRLATVVNSISSLIKATHAPPNNQVKETSFMDSFKPVYFVLRLFGLRPYSINYDSNGEPQQPKITLFDGIWLVISLGIYAMMTFFVEGINYKRLSVEGFIYVLGYIFTMYGIFCCILNVMIDVITRFKFVEILRRITIFDKEVRATSDLFVELVDNIVCIIPYRWQKWGFTSITKRHTAAICCIAYYQLSHRSQ